MAFESAAVITGRNLAQRPVAAFQTPRGRLQDIANGAFSDDVAGAPARVDRGIGHHPDAPPARA
jgi:hypothetical protein